MRALVWLVMAVAIFGLLIAANFYYNPIEFFVIDDCLDKGGSWDYDDEICRYKMGA